MRGRYLLAALIVAGMALLTSLPSSAEEAPSKDKIDKLIEQMGSGSFAEREAATKALSAIGVPALEALRQAAKSDDAEVRKRAEGIIPKIEIQAESKRVLAPKRVHLVYKNTPLNEAVADFRKKSGYTIHLHDPQGKLKERKITLDTGATSFWHALALFCAKTELTEASMADLIQMPQRPAVRAGNPAPAPAARLVVRPALVRPLRFASQEQIILKDGTAKPLPTDDHSAVRIRAQDKTVLFAKPAEDEVIVPLEVSAEPRLQWQSSQSVRIEKAVDDLDQKLTQVIPQVEGVAGFGGGNVAIGLPGGGMVMQRAQLWDVMRQQMPVQLKKGAKAAKSLKELRGVLTAQLLTEAQPMIIADKLDKSVGKVFKADVGGAIKILEVKAEEKQTMIRLQFELPPSDKVMPAQLKAVAGVAVPPPPAAVQVQIGMGGRIVAHRAGDAFTGMGLSIQDDKDNILPIQIQRTHYLGNGRATIVTYSLACQHEKDKGQSIKVVFLGRKRATVEIPFALKDVPLP